MYKHNPGVEPSCGLLVRGLSLYLHLHYVSRGGIQNAYYHAERCLPCNSLRHDHYHSLLHWATDRLVAFLPGQVGALSDAPKSHLNNLAEGHLYLLTPVQICVRMGAPRSHI